MSRTTFGSARRAAAAVAAAASITMLVSSCGSASEGSISNGEGATASIRLAFGTPNTANAPMYIAEARGFFEDENLDVELVSSTASSVQALVSNQADLIWGGITNAAIPAQEGKEVSIVYGTSGNGVTIWTVGLPSVDSVSDCKRLGSFPKGSSTYAWSEILKSGFDSDAEIIPISEAPARAAAMTAGQIDCANGSASGLEPLVANGTAKWLVRPDEPSTLPTNFPANVTEVGIIGTKDYIEKNRDAVVRLVRAIMKGSEVLKAESAETVAADLKKSEDFASFDAEALSAAIQLEEANMIPNNGRIDEASWPNTLNYLDEAELGLDVDDSKFAYDALVDMSIYDDAAG